MHLIYVHSFIVRLSCTHALHSYVRVSIYHTWVFTAHDSDLRIRTYRSSLPQSTERTAVTEAATVVVVTTAAATAASTGAATAIATAVATTVSNTHTLEFSISLLPFSSSVS